MDDACTEGTIHPAQRLRNACHYLAMTTSYYLGPRPDRFAPASWSDIEAAAVAGTLDVSRWVELKKDVPASSKGSNRELAKDLASLSIDRGTLIVGIEEESAGVAGKVTVQTSTPYRRGSIKSPSQQSNLPYTSRHASSRIPRTARSV